jgi:hypothetical protein
MCGCACKNVRYPGRAFNPIKRTKMNHCASQNQRTGSGPDHTQGDMLKECGYLLRPQPIHQYDRLVHVLLTQLNEVSLRLAQFVAGFFLASAGARPLSSRKQLLICARCAISWTMCWSFALTSSEQNPVSAVWTERRRR